MSTKHFFVFRLLIWIFVYIILSSIFRPNTLNCVKFQCPKIKASFCSFQILLMHRDPYTNRVHKMKLCFLMKLYCYIVIYIHTYIYVCNVPIYQSTHTLSFTCSLLFIITDIFGRNLEYPPWWYITYIIIHI